MTSITEDEARSEYVAGLRVLADLIESTPDLPLPDTRDICWYLFALEGEAAEGERAYETQKSRAAQLVRLLPGTQTKRVTQDLFRFQGHVGGIRTEVIVNRDAVCRAVVTGQREVTKTVPTATKEVTVTEDVVEWVCSPLLSEAGVQ